MEKFTLILSLVLAGGLCGCFSLETGKLPNGERQIVTRNYGWYLFDIVPIFCGNASEDPKCPLVMFRNDVQMDKIQHRLLAQATKDGKTVENLVWSCYDCVMFTIPVFYIQLPIPYILTYRDKQLSGVMK